MKSEPQKILVITLSNLGDVIMTTPVIMRLREEFPAAKISVVVGPKAQGLLKQSVNISEVIVYDKKAGLDEKKRFISRLREKTWDWVVDLRRTAIPVLVKAKKRSPVLMRRYRRKMKREAHLEVLEWMGLERRETKPFDFFQKKDDDAMLAKLKTLGVEEEKGWIVMAPGAASERKRWHVKNFRELAGKLYDLTGKTILLAGSPEEKMIAQKVTQDLKAKTILVCGETDLAQSAAMVSRAALVIANDSAMMHMGFELQVPTVGVFGPTDAAAYSHEGPLFRTALADHKLCSCKDHLKSKAERACFHGLESGHVFKLCRELLAEPA